MEIIGDCNRVFFDLIDNARFFVEEKLYEDKFVYNVGEI